ncbi:substrate-binding periplasmic protein [Pseudomonas cremoricolorata]|uniref:substrate-binding periplasmic protein n=1 Tax=Pseudomonas cremoricolorata TaxID=157783 RepID=UPI0009E0B19F|nr:transporter substrate-binding domain-containing protein [Pseudomonas cremoricolorata]
MSSSSRVKTALHCVSFALFWVLGAAWADEAVEVRIGAAHFPPYTQHPERGADSGLLQQLAQSLNQCQQRFRFILVPTSIPRRFADLQQGRTDLAIFENPAWGWQQIAHQRVDMALEDAEVFVARQLPGRGQAYFDTLADKRLALFSGYHYAFAGFNAERRYLLQHFNANLSYSHESNLAMVERGRVDVALVSRSYLSDYLARHPRSTARLLVSERVDQVYRHYALLRPAAPISAAQFAELLERLRAEGELTRIFAPYQIAVLPRP